MTLNGRYALYCRKDASFRTKHKNLNEDRPILSSAIMQPNDTTFWRYKVYADIRRGRWRGPSNDSAWLSTTAIFSLFAGYFSETLEIRPALLYGYTQSVVGQNAWPWMTLNSYFALKSVFAPLWLASTVKTSKDRHTVGGANLRHELYSFWKCTVCAGIRASSLAEVYSLCADSGLISRITGLFIGFYAQ